MTLPRTDSRPSLPARLWKWLTRPLTYRRIMRSPDRLVLVGEMLPLFAAHNTTILWVGVRRYTRRYPALLERGGAVCWTTDISPKAARWGRPGRHLVCDLLEIDQAFEPGAFTAVLCNGVFGFGIDDPDAQTRALEAMAAILAPGGWLLLGWNTDRTTDILELAALDRWFEPAPLGPLPARRRIAGTTHVYDLLRRRAGG